MKFNNTYYLLRHGEAVSNVKNIYSSWPETFHNPLTAKGRKMIQGAAKVLKEKYEKHEKGIDMIFASDLLRTKQTAEIVGHTLKLKPKFDKRLREIAFGSLNNKSLQGRGYADLVKKPKVPGKEPYQSVAERMYAFLKEVDKKYQGKHILIVSHQCPLWALESKVEGLSLKQAMKKAEKSRRIAKGELRKLN